MMLRDTTGSDERTAQTIQFALSVNGLSMHMRKRSWLLSMS